MLSPLRLRSLCSARHSFRARAFSNSLIRHQLLDVKKVLVVGSGGLSIGQAGEFDYSGSQAIKALMESNIKTILINPNIATIQTSHQLANEVYFLPVTPEYISHILELERPDGILLTFGGQTALNVGIQLDDMGVLSRYKCRVLGTPIQTLKSSEDRDLFAKALKGEPSVPEALSAASKIGYPIIVRSAFSLGGLGSGFANSPEELESLASKSLSLTPQILVEKSLKGWKEVEYEVVRDGANNCITICNMENFDPLGIHTGDSIVVAPSQTLSDEEYHLLRSAAIKIVRHLGVVGECNVQYALDPNGLDYRVIEVNARLSRSSALASKATGYPLAYTAAKIALGYTLPELPNAVTKTTTANFEPSLDYIVTKIPRWDLAKFTGVDRHIGSGMKSVGEVMAIGRTFEESLQKAIRQVDPRFEGFQSLEFLDLDEELSHPTDQRLFAIGNAMLEKEYTDQQIHDLTKIDMWFLGKLRSIVDIRSEIFGAKSLDNITKNLLGRAKKKGFSDKQIAKLLHSTEISVRNKRKGYGIIPFVKKIDTLAAEFPASTNYLYTTYNASTNDVIFDEHGTMVLGSGVYRIGSSVEFDWCGVSTTRCLRQLGRKTITVNYNPETVSTDFDECERLYFEELSFERVMDIYELEQAEGVIVSVGGQLPQNIALRLQESGAKVFGTDPRDIDNAEDRKKFSALLDEIDIQQPEWSELTSIDAAESFAARVGYPVLVRPSYVLSGAAMSVVHDFSALEKTLNNAVDISPDYPVVITKFIQGAKELDLDAVGQKGRLIIHAVSEHIENAGIHSGDASLVLPPVSIANNVLDHVKTIAEKVARKWNITGPFNMQIICEPNGTLKVIELNLRASRSFPFVSKVLGENFIERSTKALLGIKQSSIDPMQESRKYVAVKVPQFSWTRLAGADPMLGVEMASTGEVACFGRNLEEAFLTSIQSTQNFKIPSKGDGIVVYGNLDDQKNALRSLGYKVVDDITVTQNKKAMRELFDRLEVKLVIDPRNTDEGYHVRRCVVDFGIPLINNEKCAEVFVRALQRKSEANSIKGEIRTWADWVGKRV
ncbi:Carbamoyl-phosphate synthase arginine-specific large chain [Neolecta irregularis DAH-3]|uniref:Carbamoyl phosphate synthase arginine-specific large chain n=1 Tax=Neolecta irregularis (strain DAH-3) TaxID=1198029 RepID=A0A1U7LWE8_NEOID|nr:Carbamoyl-phosphate synthase arginine-specific large chain [Neolecta irregularis DAH-3]|eukprot:OLL26831.1 Carbamoyl-phosphate synthase arginine-specific large chain [Neolecta irregularis DAH-3]